MSVKRNTLYNVVGAISPLAVTLVTVPLYISEIGQARYGLLALVWLLLGYFGLFDLGLSTATASALARSRREDPAARSKIFMTSLLTNAALGVTVGVIVQLTAPLILTQMHQLSPGLRSEISFAIPWLAASIPLVTVGGVFNGVLSSHERFGTINLINVLGTILFQVTPLWAASAIGADLPSIIPVAVFARAIPVLLTGIASVRLISPFEARFDRATLRTLLAYGSWVMLTNLIGPILVSVDQFAVASMLGAAAVAQYSVAYSLAIRFQIVPQALTQTLFPRMSQHTPQDAATLASRAFRSVFIMITILVVPAILVVQPFISLWIGLQFSQASGPIAEILLISVWLNSLAFVPYAFLQAQGRPDIVARFHLIEIVPFLLVLYFGVHAFGLRGAAFAWALRVLMDTVLLVAASRLPAKSFTVVPIGIAALSAAWLIAESGVLGPVEALSIAVVAGVTLLGWGIISDPNLRQIAARFYSLLRGGL